MAEQVPSEWREARVTMRGEEAGANLELGCWLKQYFLYEYPRDPKSKKVLAGRFQMLPSVCE